MLSHYKYEITENGSFLFYSKHNHKYELYFTEVPVPDKHGNIHTFFHFGLTKNDEHNHILYKNKYDEKIESTILFILNDIFSKFDHRILVCFYFIDDGFSRHRKITFNKWKRGLNESIVDFPNTIKYEDKEIFICLILSNENPLKDLILEAYNNYLKELE